MKITIIKDDKFLKRIDRVLELCKNNNIKHELIEDCFDYESATFFDVVLMSNADMDKLDNLVQDDCDMGVVDAFSSKKMYESLQPKIILSSPKDIQSFFEFFQSISSEAKYG